jgi:hypothetical protein
MQEAGGSANRRGTGCLCSGVGGLGRWRRNETEDTDDDGTGGTTNASSAIGSNGRGTPEPGSLVLMATGLREWRERPAGGVRPLENQPAAEPLAEYLCAVCRAGLGGGSRP